MTSLSVLAAARTGDERAFAQLTEPHRAALQLHCYRMLGSVQDAEDTVQETLVSAWRGLDGYEGRASIRGWLTAIATHRCLNIIRQRARRPQPTTGLSFSPPAPTRMSEITWLEPFPDHLLDALPDGAPGPDARYEVRESLGLAFIAGLQRLPPRQRAVLVLRDVLGYRAAEVAEMLDASEATVTSSLQRARAALEARPVGRERAPAPGSPAERAVADAFASAFVAADFDSVVAMLTDDAWVTMPPEPHEYQGPEAIRGFFAAVGRTDHGERPTRLVPARANGQPAFGHYVQAPGEAMFRLTGLLVLDLAGDQILAITRFGLSNLPPQLGLPAQL